MDYIDRYLIFNQNTIVGFTHSWQEADDICKINSDLIWDREKKDKVN